MQKAISIIVVLLSFAALTACNGQHDKAVKQKEAIESLRMQLSPGMVATSGSGWTMRAKINGKQWTASAMMPPLAASRIIGYNGESDYISFPFDIRNMVVGRSHKISDHWAVDFVNKSDGICGGTTGEMDITNIQGDWVEGTFHFLVPSCNNTLKDPPIQVTDGFFRISVAK